jgi:flagellar biogenesis protein FliO
MFLLLGSSLSAVMLLDTKVYERSDRVDLLLMFDAPYGGKISQKKDSNGIILTLHDISIQNYTTKHINSDILNGFAIKNEHESLKIYLYSQQNFGLLLSKTNDGYGLRIRAKESTPEAKDRYAPKENAAQNIDSINLDSRYYVALFALILIVIMLFVIKRFILSSASTGWLVPTEMKESKIIFQRGIDSNNKVILFEYQGIQYLMLVGNSNVLLEKFDKKREQKREFNFEQEFLNNKQKLDEYLKIASKENSPVNSNH